MELMRVTWGKGLNKDVPAWELADGYCSSATNVRFRDGLAERVGGVLDATTTYLASVPHPPEIAQLYTSASSSTGRYLVYASIGKVYADNLAQTKAEITRYSDAIEISSITRVGTTATLTTSSSHGRSTADNVTIYGASPSQYNGTFSITVTSPTTFTYTMGSDPGASASPVGAYYFATSTDFTGLARAWSSAVLNGVQILNNDTNGLYYWSGDTAVRVRKFPQSYVADCARVFESFIIQLAPTVSGTKYRHRVLWSASAEPGTIPASFAASSTNDAGFVELAETPGTLVDCMPWGSTNIVYKEDARFAQTYIGGNDVFRFDRLPGDEGLIAKNCVVNTPKGQVFMTANYDVMIHQGGAAVSIAQGRVRSALALLSPSYKTTTFLAVNPAANEVWVVFPSGPSTIIPDTALIWNWDSDTWGSKTLAGMQCAASGLITTALGAQYMMLGGTFTGVSFRFGLVDLSNTDFGVSFTSTLERQGLTDGDTDSVKFLSRSRHQYDGALPLTVYHGAAMVADAAVSYSSGVTYTPGATNFANARAVGGRYMAIKFTMPSPVSPALSPSRLRSSELEYVKGGRR